jgi:DNA-binding response OmpR family regulator
LLFDFYPEEEEKPEEKEESFQENEYPKKGLENTENLTNNQTGKIIKKEVIHTKNQTSDYQQLDLFCRTKIETSPKQALIPYINNTNIPNISNNLKIVNLDEQAKKIENDDINTKYIFTLRGKCYLFKH